VRDPFNGPCQLCGLYTHAPCCGRRFLRIRNFGLGRVVILFLRHGETDEDVGDNPKFSGPGEIPLNDAGKKQMADAAEFLRSRNVAWLLSSPIPRSKASTEIVGAALGLSVKVFDPLRDWNIGAAAGGTVKQLLPFTIFFERNPDLPIPGGQPYAEWWGKAGDGLEYLLDMPYEDAELVAVTHSRFIARAKMHLDGKAAGQTNFNWSPKPGGIGAVSRDASGYKFELVHGEWNGETR